MAFPPIDPATIGKAFNDGRAYTPRHFTNDNRLNKAPVVPHLDYSADASLLTHFAAFVAGCFLTVALAWVWAVLS